MKQAIIIGSYRGSPWLERCVNSIPSNLPVIVMRSGGYECGAIRAALTDTNLDRFLFLQDSTEVVCADWIYENWGSDESVSLNAEPREYGSFLGWWKRSVLERTGVPVTPTKMDAVFAEMDLSREYCGIEKPRILWPHFTLQNATLEVIHGREIMVYRNEHLVKYKGAWSGETIGVAQARDDLIHHKLP